MELKELKSRLVSNVKKFKIPLLILMIGVLFLLYPGKKGSAASQNASVTQQISATETDEEKLEGILAKIHGAGEVAVMLTAAEGKETVYQTNDQQTGEEAGRVDTVTVTDCNRNETGLIKQINPARYQGAIIVCAGADDPGVRLAIVDAVSKATGLGADQISVSKMK